MVNFNQNILIYDYIYKGNEMKHIVFLISVFIFISLSYSQEKEVAYTEIIKVDSVEKKQLYTVIHQWFATTYKSAQDVIQMAEKDAGIIIGKGTIKYSYGKLSYTCYNGRIDYTIKIQVKDYRFKVDISDFIHIGNVGNETSCGLGLITTRPFYTNKGISKKYHNKVWIDLQETTKTYSSYIFTQLTNATTISILNDKSTDDW